MVRFASETALLSRMGSLYLRARWFWGLGMLLFPLVLAASGTITTRVWAVAAAGAVILVHSLGLALWKVEAVVSTLFVDIVVTHIAVFLSVEGSDHTGVLLTLVGFAVLITLFAQGWAKWVALALNFVSAAITILHADGWWPGHLVGSLAGGLFVVAVVVAVLTSFRDRLFRLEVERAVTLGVASHELRNRLTGVIGITELLIEGNLPRTHEMELAAMAHAEAEEAAHVIDDLLTASQSERGMLDAESEAIDVTALARQAVERFAPDGEGAILVSADEPIWAMADPMRLGQVLRNLLSNAERYGGDTVRVTVGRLGDSVSVMVSDDGDGVHPDDVPALFQAYRRSRHRAAAPGSTGLGLWISRGLARSMGGDLVYRREEGCSIFEVKLIATEALSRAAA